MPVWKHLAIAAIAAVGVCLAQAPVPPPPTASTKIDFSAPPQLQTIELLPSQSKSTQHPVKFNFDGWLYQPEGLSLTSPDVAKFPLEEKRLVAAISAAKKGGIIAIVPFWAPGEQATIRKTVSEPTVNTGMTNFLRSVENSVILAKILYGPYSILLVQHIGQSLPAGQAPARYAMKKVGEQFYLTDDLSGDPVFIYFAEKYVRQLVARITGQAVD